MRPAEPIAIALGSNLGDRQSFLALARRRLSAEMRKTRWSTFHDTEPVGVGDQPRFLNGAMVGVTSLEPRALLELLLAIEEEAGRTRPFAGAARTLDLDLILYGARVIDEPGFQVPHPRFRERRFVLSPLAEIASDWRDPVTGLTVGQLLKRCGPA